MSRLDSCSRAIYAVRLLRGYFASDEARRCVCRYSQRPKMACEPLSPLPERGFAKVQPLAVFASGLENQVDMRMRLIRVEGHHIPMLERKLLPGEIPYRRLDLFGRRSGGHGEDEFVDQSLRLLWLIGGQIVLVALLDQIKIPILQESLPDLRALQDFSLIGFKLHCTLPTNIANVPA